MVWAVGGGGAVGGRGCLLRLVCALLGGGRRARGGWRIRLLGGGGHWCAVVEVCVVSVPVWNLHGSWLMGVVDVAPVFVWVPVVCPIGLGVLGVVYPVRFHIRA